MHMLPAVSYRYSVPFLLFHVMQCFMLLQERADSAYSTVASDDTLQKKLGPVLPEVKAMHVELKEVVNVLLCTLPLDSQQSAKIVQGDAHQPEEDSPHYVVCKTSCITVMAR